jgi:PKD repeat protein
MPKAKAVLTTLMLAIGLSIALVLPGQSVAQQLGGRIAYDNCYSTQGEGGFEVQCYVHVFDPGRSGYLYSPGLGVDPGLSPDGSHLAFVSDRDSRTQITVVNLQSGSRAIVFHDPAASVHSPTWSADGRMAFASLRGGTWELYVMNADGTGLRHVTTAVGFRGSPSWSADGRIAFECEIEVDNRDICTINADGTGFTRLTHSALDDESAPAFSPDGTRIVFNGHGAGSSLSILNADGSVIRLGVWGIGPVWSPDATRLAYYQTWSFIFCAADGRLCEFADIYTANLDGTGETLLRPGANPSWTLSTGGLPPLAYFTAACTDLTCTFDASASVDDGSIVRYEWQFGDGTTATGKTTSHNYASASSFTVDLTVIDDSGTRATTRRTLPVASFTVQCNGLYCFFNGIGSYPPDGIAAYTWSFGDGTVGGGAQAGHRYMSAGTYTVTLSVRDHSGVTDTERTTLTVTNRPPLAAMQFSCDSLTCTFTGSPSWDADGAIVSYAWSFGDGTQAAGVSVTHVFAAAGTYSAVLTVTDDIGDTGTAAVAVTVAQRVTHIGDPGWRQQRSEGPLGRVRHNHGSRCRASAGSERECQRCMEQWDRRYVPDRQSGPMRHLAHGRPKLDAERDVYGVERHLRCSRVRPGCEPRCRRRYGRHTRDRHETLGAAQEEQE